MVGGANEHGIREEMPPIDARLGTAPLGLAKVLKAIAGMERVHRHCALLALTGRLQWRPGRPIDLGQG